MVLISRIFTYFVPLIYLLVGLSWLIHSGWVFYGSALVILLLMASIYSISGQTGGIRTFLFELIYPLFTQIIGLAFLVFIPKNWLYVIVVIFFSTMLFLILNESFNRHHPFLGKSFDFNIKLQTVLIITLSFFIAVIGYSFILYINWPLWLVILLFIILMSLLLLRLHGYNRKLEFLLVDIAVIALTLELFFILHYLPMDIYLKSLIVSSNLFIIFSYIVNKEFYKINNQYGLKEKN